MWEVSRQEEEWDAGRRGKDGYFKGYGNNNNLNGMRTWSEQGKEKCL